MNESPALARLHRATLEARRTRAGVPVSRFAGFGAAPRTGKVPAKWQISHTALIALAKATARPAPQAASHPVPHPSPHPSPHPALQAARPPIFRRGLPARSFHGLGFSTVGAAGTAVGFIPVVGQYASAVMAIAGMLFHKKYFNVGQSNQVCQQLMALWQKYLTIQGHVAGRALGWPTMLQLFHASVGAGLYPGNAMHLSFHEGTLACAGHGNWADSFIGETLQGKPMSCAAHNCLPDALARFNPAAVPSGTPDAVYFIDQIVLPMNAHDAIPWIYNGAQNPQVHQLLYDLADAYLAAHLPNTTPYVEYPAGVAPGMGSSATGATGTSSVTGYPGVSTYATGTGSSGAVTTLPQLTQVGTDPTSGAPVYSSGSGYYEIQNGQAVPYTPTVTQSGQPALGAPTATAPATIPAGTVAALSTGGFSLSPTMLLLIGVGLVGAFGYAFMTEKGKRVAAHSEAKK